MTITFRTKETNFQRGKIIEISNHFGNNLYLYIRNLEVNRVLHFHVIKPYLN